MTRTKREAKERFCDRKYGLFIVAFYSRLGVQGSQVGKCSGKNAKMTKSIFHIEAEGIPKGS